jgi:hypothetical protein
MTIINGKIVFKDGKLININETEVAKDAMKHSENLVKMKRGEN